MKNRYIPIISVLVLACAAAAVLIGIYGDSDKPDSSEAVAEHGLAKTDETLHPIKTTTAIVDSTENADEETRLINIFGTEQSSPINAGFVFYDGRYLDSPYVISRKGLSVYVNECRFYRGQLIEEHQVATGDEDPVMPKEISKQTSMYDRAFKDYVGRKIAYVQKHYSPDEERRIMEQIYRDLPCTREARLHPQSGSLIVNFFNGDETAFALAMPRRKPLIGREAALRQAEFQRKNLVSRLLKNDTYFFFSSGGHMTFGEQGTITYLPKIAKILRSDRSIDEKFKAVQKTGLPSVGPDSFRSLVTDFSASEQLEHRLEQLIRLQDRLPKEAATESQPSTPHL